MLLDKSSTDDGTIAQPPIAANPRLSVKRFLYSVMYLERDAIRVLAIAHDLSAACRVGPPLRLGYTAVMTRSLTAAIEKLEALPPEEQDRVATWLLDELTDEAKWAQQFAASQDLLADLANEALIDHAEGRTRTLDPDKL